MAVLLLVGSILAVSGAAQGVERHDGARRLATTLLKVEPGRTVWLRERRGGFRIARVGDRTEFGSPTVLAVLVRHGEWARVSHPSVANRLGWMRVGTAVRRARTAYSVRVDLAARRATVLSSDRVVRRVRVSIGARGSPTPTGRFQVTDRLAGRRFSASYGCCILALSGRQPNLPSGWQGGDRLAVHGTPVPERMGRAVTAGCLRAADADMRWLTRHLPIGTPVRITRAG
jgi:lipoprotein-anchoring transpeptidase ErfK/SrfK